MTKDEVISKVQKLFELANSPNENEAASAASKARELLSRHNLSMADLPADELKNVIAATEKSVGVGKVLRNWVKGLLIHIAEGFECEHIIRRRYECPPLLTFIGTQADAEVAVYTFQFLYRELNSCADRALPSLKRANRDWSAAALRYAYLDGAVHRIGERFREQTLAVREAEHTGCKDLVLAKEQIIRTYMASTYAHVKMEYGKRRAVSADAFQRGYRDAADISLRKAVGDRASDPRAVSS
jgi:hypothetical protein